MTGFRDVKGDAFNMFEAESLLFHVRNGLSQGYFVVLVLLYSPKRPARLEGNMPFHWFRSAAVRETSTIPRSNFQWDGWKRFLTPSRPAALLGGEAARRDRAAP